MTIQEVARQLAGRLKQSEFASESDMEDIIGNFEDMADDPDTDTEDYDQILSELSLIGATEFG